MSTPHGKLKKTKASTMCRTVRRKNSKVFTKLAEVTPTPSNTGWNVALRKMMGWEDSTDYRRLVRRHNESCPVCDLPEDDREDIEQQWIFGEPSHAVTHTYNIVPWKLRRHFVATGLHWVRIAMRWLIRAELLTDEGMRKSETLELMRDLDKAEGIGQGPMIAMMAAMTQQNGGFSGQQTMVDLSGMSDAALQEFMRVYSGESEP